LAYATIIQPVPGVPAAVGIFLASRFIPSFTFSGLARLRVNLVLVLVFSFLDPTYLRVMVSEFSGNHTVRKIGGGVCPATLDRGLLYSPRWFQSVVSTGRVSGLVSILP
jgi:succinate-acetate transporter protein